MSHNEICDLCTEQTTKSRRDNPHQYLELIEEKPIRGSMFGGWEEYTYICKKCGATMHHTNDKNEFLPFWTITEK